MLTLELLEVTKEYVQYKFYPEGIIDTFGIVQVNLNDFSRVLVKDVDGVSSGYKGQAWAQVERLARKGTFPEKSGAAWG